MGEMIAVMREQKLRILGLVVVLGLAVLGGSSVLADEDGTSHLVAVYDRGTKKVVRTKVGVVSEVLDEMGIEVAENDRVEPGLDEVIGSKQFSINVYRARPVLVIDGMRRERIMTAAQTEPDIAEDAGIELFEKDELKIRYGQDVLLTGTGIELLVRRSKPVNVVLYGERMEMRTLSETVGEFLDENGISEEDYVSVARDTVIVEGMELEIWRNGKNVVVVTEEVDFAVEQVRDYDRERGYREITIAGEKGQRVVTFEIEMLDGVEVSRNIVNDIMTKQPKVQREIVGARMAGTVSSPTENEKITWNYLIEQGFSREQTAGIMGNLMQEHQFSTNGDGLAQWMGGRKANLMAREDPYNIHTQLDYLMWELNGGYISVKNAILATDSIEVATQIFQDRFERCNPLYCMLDRRINYAYDIYDRYK